MKAKWYAIHVFSQSENRVKTLIEKMALKKGLQSKINQVIIPVDTDVKKKLGKKVECQTKVFPGYILINMELDEESFIFIKSIPGVTNFVSSGSKVQANKRPVAMKDEEVQRIIDSLNPNTGFKPKKKWMKDMVVRIIDGPFSDFTGKIEDVNEEKETMKIMISLFGRDTPIEIDFVQVDKV